MDTSDQGASGEQRPTAAESQEGASERVFRTNLEAFGGRAARLCALLRRRRISTDSCFLALTQLWIQLARSHRRLDDPAEGDGQEG